MKRSASGWRYDLLPALVGGPGEGAGRVSPPTYPEQGAVQETRKGLNPSVPGRAAFRLAGDFLGEAGAVLLSPRVALCQVHNLVLQGDKQAETFEVIRPRARGRWLLGFPFHRHP